MAIRCVSLICLFLALFVSADEIFVIKRNNQKNFQDRFKVPQSPNGDPDPDTVCRRRFGAGRFNNTKDCLCPLENATFGYYNNIWTCYGNKVLRTRVGCNIQFTSSSSHRGDALWVVNAYSNGDTKPYPVNLTTEGSCQINTATSKYKTCAGEWRSLFPSGNLFRFSLVQNSLQVEKSTNESKHLNGALIKLEFSCAKRNQHCLLFKVRGIVKCPVKPPVPSRSPSTVIQPTPTPTTWYSQTSVIISYAPSRPATIAPTTVQSIPMPSSSAQVPTIPRGKDINSGSSSKDKKITFITTSVVAAVLLVIAAVIALTLYSRRKRKNESRAGTSRANVAISAAADARTAHSAPSCDPSDDGVYDNLVFDNTVKNDVGETEANSLYCTAQEMRNQLPGSKQRASPDAYQELLRTQQGEDSYQTLTDHNDDFSTNSYKTPRVGSNQAAVSEVPSGGAPCDNPIYENTDKTAHAGLSCDPSGGGVYDNLVFDNTVKNDVGETEGNPMFSTAQEMRNQLPGSKQRASPDAYQELFRMQQGGHSYQTLTDHNDDFSTNSYKTPRVGSNQAAVSGVPSGGAPCDNPIYENTDKTAHAGLSCDPSGGGVYDNLVFDNTVKNDVGETEGNPMFSTAQEMRNQLPGSEQRANPDAYQELFRMQQGGDSYQTPTRGKNTHF